MFDGLSEVGRVLMSLICCTFMFWECLILSKVLQLTIIELYVLLLSGLNEGKR